MKYRVELGFERLANRLPLLGERAGVRGKPNTKPKPTTRFSPLNTMSVSSSTALDLHHSTQ